MKKSLSSYVMKFRERSRFIGATMLSGWGGGGQGAVGVGGEREGGFWGSGVRWGAGFV